MSLQLDEERLERSAGRDRLRQVCERPFRCGKLSLELLDRLREPRWGQLGEDPRQNRVHDGRPEHFAARGVEYGIIDAGRPHLQGVVADRDAALVVGRTAIAEDTVPTMRATHRRK